MPNRRYAPEEIIGKLPEAELLLVQDQTAGKATRALAFVSLTSGSPKWLLILTPRSD
jgi:hypothetical protein